MLFELRESVFGFKIIHLFYLFELYHRLNRLYINHKMVKICAQEETYLRTCLIRTEENPKVNRFLSKNVRH